MTEFYTVKRIDNSRLRRQTDPHRLRECCRRMLWGAALAGCLFLYSWQHFECIQLRYQLESLQAQRVQAAELNQKLRIEVSALRSPARIDSIAREQLGLTTSDPGLLVPAQASSEAVLAQLRSGTQPQRP